jgi:phosphopantothenoylcysteine synthetase/decarboxylase
MKKLAEQIPRITLKKNSYGNYEHEETGFLLCDKTQKVYGRQNKDGTVTKLVSGDIDLCNKYKFDYILPDNLDVKDEDDDDLEMELDDDDLEMELEEELEEEIDEELEEEIDDLEY